MKDFDSMFMHFFVNWCEENSNLYTQEQAESMIGQLYNKWLITPLEELDSLTPSEYVDSLDVLDILTATAAEGKVSQLVADALASSQSNAPVIFDYLCGALSDEDFAITLIGILDELDYKQAYSHYIKWLLFGKLTPEISNKIIDTLIVNIDDTAPILLEQYNELKLDAKRKATDILVYHKGNELVFQQLLHYFTMGDDIVLYASYLAKYEDDRAVPVLEKYLEVCNYVEFIEIKNAIERLGGEVTIKRDFTNDVTYYAASSD